MREKGQRRHGRTRSSDYKSFSCLFTITLGDTLANGRVGVSQGIFSDEQGPNGDEVDEDSSNAGSLYSASLCGMMDQDGPKDVKIAQVARITPETTLSEEEVRRLVAFSRGKAPRHFVQPQPLRYPETSHNKDN